MADTRTSILVVDDEADVVESLRDLLRLDYQLDVVMPVRGPTARPMALASVGGAA